MRVYMCVYMCTYECARVCVCACMCMCVCVCVYMCVCGSVHMYIYVYVLRIGNYKNFLSQSIIRVIIIIIDIIMISLNSATGTKSVKISGKLAPYCSPLIIGCVF